ncbi:MAG TPA: hypothetical protein PK280_07530 [Planctomycetota bacterium]|nr:hypothetical protein [Planctomycetota bacterium]
MLAIRVLMLAGFLQAAALAAAPAGGGSSTGGVAGGPPPSTLRVERAADTVILTDGTKLTGTILAAGQRSVIIIEQDQTSERIIPRSDVESFSYSSKGSGEVKGYTTGVRPDEGLPVITGEGSAAAGSPGTPGGGGTPANPSGNKPPAGGGAGNPPKAGGGAGPGANPGGGGAAGGGRDRSKLWALLGGTASAAEIKAAVEANPQWRGEIRRLMSGEIPAEGADAVASFRARVAKDPELAKLLLEWTSRQGRTGGGAGGGKNGGEGQGGGHGGRQ